MRTVHVRTSSATYEARISADLLAQLGPMTLRAVAPRTPRRAFVVHDSGLPLPTLETALGSLRSAGLTVSTAMLTATEVHKSIGELDRVLGLLAASLHERFEPVIALGGGIVGDLAGFAAAVYRRGVPVVQCPTTLLSMVDASVGGKTGVNLLISAATDGMPRPGPAARYGDAGTLKKNLIGAFHQPVLVLADVATLVSLPERNFRAGLAECIKHGMISAGLPAPHSDAALFGWTQTAIPAISARDRATLSELIARNIAIKAAVVGSDEREELPADRGGRALLNLGHTFGHAIEPLAHLAPDDNIAGGPLHHGEAVAIGLHAAAHCAGSAGLCSAAVPAAVESALQRAGLPARMRGLPANDRLLHLMSHDKKVVGGKMRLVLPTGDHAGTCGVFEDVDPKHIEAGWDAVRS